MRLKTVLFTFATLVLGFAAPAQAALEYWGTKDDAKACEKDIKGNDSIYYAEKYLADASAGCKAEVDKRAQVCLKDAASAAWAAKDPKAREKVCAARAYVRIQVQLMDDRKRSLDRWDGWVTDVEATEAPKPSMQSKDVEKMVAKCYQTEYPEAKVFKVVLTSNEWSTERSNYGVIVGRYLQGVVVAKLKEGSCELHDEAWFQEYKGGKYTGGLSMRGAGSQKKSAILCSRVE